MKAPGLLEMGLSQSYTVPGLGYPPGEPHTEVCTTQGTADPPQWTPKATGVLR